MAKIDLKPRRGRLGYKSTARLKRDAFAFMTIGDGLTLIVLNRGKGTSPVVGFLGSEGDTFTIANSVEEFLHLLASGETGVMDLDGDTDQAPGRARLKAWLKKNKIEIPKSNPFDLTAYLDGQSGEAKPKSAPMKVNVVLCPELKQLHPAIQKAVSMLGRRADDPALIEYFEGIGQKSSAQHH